ncbi:MFS transporter [Flavobacterium sp. 7A]|uniref:MFS transporter n=1 Tax=Flavobacterium sp. 7A TaxID=2940571 RepID=UPI002227BA28|nr:MFS transporter [Flavobacterium sp. 7A]MCW2120559.1 MFS family permease [Flavobacterium sp. 7A]
MQKWQQSIVVYIGGLLTGFALILYPALGPVFTDSTQFGFSSDAFGRIFIPQTLFAIVSALSAPFIVSKIGVKKVLLSGVLSLAVAMILLYLSHFYIENKSNALWLIFSGTSFLGLGFGLVITVLNPMAFKLFPKNELASVTGLHFSLGLGTAGAPLLIGILRSSLAWWYLPLYISTLLFGLLIFIISLSFEQSDKSAVQTLKIPLKLWGFVALITLYGICEGTMGSYGAVFLKNQGLSIQNASFGLALFWTGLAFGRILFSLLSVRFNTKWIYIVSPILLAILLFILPSSNNVLFMLSAMTLAGLLMSSIFPDTVSWATKEFSNNALVVSALMVAALQFGTGISTNFLGYLSIDYSMSILMRFIAGIAFSLFVLILIIRKYSKF